MTDPHNIYKNAPDEFAEFLDSPYIAVSLKKLRGKENPFVKLGIYQEHGYSEYESITCKECGEEITIHCPDFDGKHLSYPTTCNICNKSFLLDGRQFILYRIHHDVLADFISKGIGCPICRQYKKTGYMFGKLRGYDVYYASKPAEGMYKALEAEPKSILIIGQNNPSSLPSALAHRVIYLSRLLFVENGELKFANEAIEEKIPQSRSKAKLTSPNAVPKRKKKVHLPIQIYTPYYLAMVKAWIKTIRDTGGKYKKPPMKWMQSWLAENGPLEGHRLCVRQIHRHIELLESEVSDGKVDHRNPIFTMYYNGCESMQFVENFFEKDLVAEIQKTMQRATKIPGYRIRPMRTCDAAEIARSTCY